MTTTTKPNPVFRATEDVPSAEGRQSLPPEILGSASARTLTDAEIRELHPITQDAVARLIETDDDQRFVALVFELQRKHAFLTLRVGWREAVRDQIELRKFRDQAAMTAHWRTMGGRYGGADVKLPEMVTPVDPFTGMPLMNDKAPVPQWPPGTILCGTGIAREASKQSEFASGLARQEAIHGLLPGALQSGNVGETPKHLRGHTSP